MMNDGTELRPLRPEEMEEYHRFIHYAFGLDEDFEDWDKRRRERCPDPDTLVRFGYFVDDRLTSTCGYIPFRVSLRGREFPMAGITSVTTPPEYRRRGYVADMLKRLLHLLRERGFSLSGLWPFSREFYSRFGWATCAEYSSLTVETAEFRKLLEGSRPRAQFFPATLCDVPDLQDVRNRWTSPFSFNLVRDREDWRLQTFLGWKRTPYVYVSREEDGVADAYVSYKVTECKPWDRDLEVRDMGYRDVAGYRKILAFLANHDSQVNRFHLTTSISDPLFEWLPAAETTREAGVMVRVSDIPSILGKLRVPEGVRGRAVLRVTDGFFPAAAGVFLIEVSPDGILVSDTEEPPDVQMSAGSLSQLITGYRSLSDLVRFGNAEIPGRNWRLLHALLPPGETHLPEYF
ncbi:MAG: GNAT family N-acetyltransferase [Bacillota bacterium]